ncbi:MAG: DUF503 domain-containing protein [Polyangiaceae bacterium]|nr:DUF503 domain-containing protein [Polyangiaceae bacterium]
MHIPGARSLKERRMVVKSFKDRVRARLPVSVAEVGDVERYQLATLGVVVVARDSDRCREVLSAASSVARQLSNAVLSDVKSEILPFGEGGKSLRGGIEHALESDTGEFGFTDVEDLAPETFEAPPGERK